MLSDLALSQFTRIQTFDELKLETKNEKENSLASNILSRFKNLKTSGLNCQDPGLTSRAACLVWALGTAPTCHYYSKGLLAPGQTSYEGDI